jgi:hypothetical protein
MQVDVLTSIQIISTVLGKIIDRVKQFIMTDYCRCSDPMHAKQHGVVVGKISPQMALSSLMQRQVISPQ